MAEPAGTQKAYRAFVSAPFDTNLSLLNSTLALYGVEILSLDDLSTRDKSLLNSTTELIGKADFVIAVIEERINSNVSFELGLATALGRPLLIIGKGPIPSVLQSAAVLSVPMDNEASLKFQLGAFLEHVDLLRSPLQEQPVDFDMLTSNRDVESLHFQSSKERRSNLKNLNFENSAQHRLFNAFKFSSEIDSFAVEPQEMSDQKKFLPDFAAWFSPKHRFFRGPLVVELKAGQRVRNTRGAINQVRRYTEKLGAAAGLVVVDGGSESSLRATSLSPLICVVGLTEIEELLAHSELASAMRSARNRLAHLVQ